MYSWPRTLATNSLVVVFAAAVMAKTCKSELVALPGSKSLQSFFGFPPG